MPPQKRKRVRPESINTNEYPPGSGAVRRYREIRQRREAETSKLAQAQSDARDDTSGPADSLSISDVPESAVNLPVPGTVAAPNPVRQRHERRLLRDIRENRQRQNADTLRRSQEQHDAATATASPTRTLSADEAPQSAAHPYNVGPEASVQVVLQPFADLPFLSPAGSRAARRKGTVIWYPAVEVEKQTSIDYPQIPIIQRGNTISLDDNPPRPLSIAQAQSLLHDDAGTTEHRQSHDTSSASFRIADELLIKVEHQDADWKEFVDTSDRAAKRAQEDADAEEILRERSFERQLEASRSNSPFKEVKKEEE